MERARILLAHGSPVVLANLVEELKRRRLEANIVTARDGCELIRAQCFHPARVVLVDLGFESIGRILQCLAHDPAGPGIYACPSSSGPLPDLQGVGRLGRRDAPVGVICDQLAEMLCESESPAERATRCARRRESVDQLLFEAGLSVRSKGGRYLRLALNLAAEDARLLDNLEGRLYPAVALQCGDLPANVERGIRYAVEIFWRRMPPEDRLYLLPRCGAKPGNKQLLSALHQRLKGAESLFP